MRIYEKGLVALLLVCTCLASSAQAGFYKIVDLGILPDAAESFANDINDSGQIVGVSGGFIVGGYGGRAFLYENGVMKDLGTLGGASSVAYGINDLGQIVGRADTADGASHAFLYDNGVMKDLGTLGGASSVAHDINNLGQIVGESRTVDGNFHAFLYENGSMEDLGTLGGVGSYGRAINDHGQIVGSSYPSGSSTYQAFLYENGVMRELGVSWSSGSLAHDINNFGQVVGRSGSHGFLYENGVKTRVGDLGGTGGSAEGINDAGVIVGWGFAPDHRVHPFLHESGVLSVLPTLCGGEGSADAINNGGLIVGWTNSGPEGASRATLWTPSSIPAADMDKDCIRDDIDNCPNTVNPDQRDCDGDGTGDACDPDSLCSDSDGDLVVDPEDNCPKVSNPGQSDCDGDGLGDACDPNSPCLIGLFTIEAGSNFFMEGVGGASFLGGSDGGLITGIYQPDPPPTVPSGDSTGAVQIIDPLSFHFFGFPFWVSTNEVDPVDGVTTYPVPMIVDNQDGTITGNLSSWDANIWGSAHVNQGAPKDNSWVGQPDNPAPVGSYDPTTGAYELKWTSLIVGGAFDGFSGQWTLVGHGPTRPVDLDGDGYGANDCDDQDPSIHPGAVEICGNHMDENCDGVAEVCRDHDLVMVSIRVPKKIRNCSTRAKKIRSEVENRGQFTEVIYVRLTANGTRVAGASLVLDPASTARVSFDVLPNTLAVGQAEICVEAIIQGADSAPADNKTCGMMTVVGCQ